MKQVLTMVMLMLSLVVGCSTTERIERDDDGNCYIRHQARVIGLKFDDQRNWTRCDWIDGDQ